MATLALLGAAPAWAAKAKAKPRAKAPAHVADGSLADWRGQPTYLAGRSQVSRGELIYTDYLYDDYGPDLNGRPDQPVFRSQLAPTNGDYRYPADPARYGYNAADLRELRLAVDRRKLHALIGLQTMKVADAAAAIIAIDTDGRAETGPAEWPDGAGIATPGADRFVTVWGTGGHVVDAGGTATPVKVAVDLQENAIEVDVPLAALGPVADGARVWVGTGLAREGGGGFAPQSGRTALFNVGFRGDDDWPRLVGHWGEHEQSQALANADVSGFAGRLDFGALQRRRSIPFDVAPGFYDRIFRSKYDYGEGIEPKTGGVGGSPAPMFLSAWQPYGLYIPKGYDPARPPQLLLNGHSLDVNHNEYRAVGPNQLVELGDDRYSITFTPLARGIDTWYLDAGFGDVMEAWDDVVSHYAVDRERTSITGYSMGGYMTYRLGLLMPDRFARASAYVGPPAYAQWAYPAPPQGEDEAWVVRGNTNRLVGNALNLPFEIVSGHADELVPYTGVQHQFDTFKAAGNAVALHEHLADDHFSFIMADRWGHTRAFLGDARIDPAPVRVRYTRMPSQDLPKYGLRFDRAYWVSAIVVRDAPAEDSTGTVDAMTFGLGGNEMVAKSSSGPDPDPVGVTPAILHRQVLEPGAAIQRRNGFGATLTNVSDVTFDLARMGLNRRQPVEMTVNSDGPSKVRLLGRYGRGVTVTVDGGPASFRRVKKELRAMVPAGQHTVRIAPRAAARQHGG
jgi:dienelactone hydrolase